MEAASSPIHQKGKRGMGSDLLQFSSLIVAPDTINNHVKTCREEQKNLHFFAPEYGGTNTRVLGPAVLH